MLQACILLRKRGESKSHVHLHRQTTPFLQFLLDKKWRDVTVKLCKFTHFYKWIHARFPNSSKFVLILLGRENIMFILMVDREEYDVSVNLLRLLWWISDIVWNDKLHADINITWAVESTWVVNCIFMVNIVYCGVCWMDTGWQGWWCEMMIQIDAWVDMKESKA